MEASSAVGTDGTCATLQYGAGSLLYTGIMRTLNPCRASLFLSTVVEFFVVLFGLFVSTLLGTLSDEFLVPWCIAMRLTGRGKFPTDPKKHTTTLQPTAQRY